jgi:uncharacterized membrane protein YbhN (UPF0104 family)
VGIVFSLLLGLALVLINVSVPSNPATPGEWLTDGAHRTTIDVALNLVPIAGITFLGFIGVARDRIGPREDRFLATLFLGSGLLFVAMLFAAAALADGIITDVASGSSAAPAPGTLAIGRQVTGLLLRVYATRMAAVFTLSTSIITFRTAVIPRRIAVLGFPVAVVLLISVGLTPWVELLFPAWVLLLSTYILWTGLRQPCNPVGTAMATGALPSASGLSAVPARQLRGRAATAEGEEVTVATPATQGAPSAGPRVGPAVASTRTAERLRAVVLGPRGGGTTRRRASDAFRLGFAAAGVAVSIPVMRANSAVELSIVHALHPPPTGIRWLVTATFWGGSVGVVACLAVVGLLVPRLPAVRQIVVASLATWGLCALLAATLGSAAGRPATGALAGVGTSYPVSQLAVAIAVAATALPYLSRSFHRLVSFLVVVAAIAAVVDGSALPVNTASSLLLGWGLAACLHLAVGSPLGLPSPAEVSAGMADLNVVVAEIGRAPHQVWGVERLTGRGPDGSTIELSVYGRDAADARALAKLWRFCFYRDSGPTLILGRIQQVEHEAYQTFMAARAGVLVPEVLAVGRFGPSRDAVLVSRLPGGPALGEADPAAIADGTLDEILRTVLRLRQAGIAHGALGAETILLSADGICVRDFRSAASPPPAGRFDDDLAAVLAAVAVRFGVDRTAAAAGRVLDANAARGALVHLQRSALDPVTVSSLRGHKGLLAELRTAVASVAGIEVPKLAEAKRVSWVNLLFGIGSLIGVWAIVGVLTDVAGSFDVIKGARWGWVTLTFVLAQLPVAASAWATVGAATGQLPYGRCLALETSNMFTALAGGDVAVFAVRVRFFQRQGYDSVTALSSGAIASAASWVAKGLLFLASIGFAAGTFHSPATSGGHQKVIWAVAGVVLAAGIAAAVITVIPRLRRLTSARVRPHLAHIWADIKSIAAEPRKIVYVLAGSVLSQLLVALALGAALHAVGEKASIATLLVVITTASMIGSAVPVPGGAGVVEAGLIAGLTSAGVPQDQAVAAIFIQRLFTAYLPPIWGWVTLAWMRRRAYV